MTPECTVLKTDTAMYTLAVVKSKRTQSLRMPSSASACPSLHSLPPHLSPSSPAYSPPSSHTLSISSSYTRRYTLHWLHIVCKPHMHNGSIHCIHMENSLFQLLSSLRPPKCNFTHTVAGHTLYSTFRETFHHLTPPPPPFPLSPSLSLLLQKEQVEGHVTRSWF